MTNITQSYADLWSRVLAFAFDYLAILLYLIVLFIISLVVSLVLPTIASTMFGNPVSGQIIGFFTLTLPVTLYFALLESSPWQATWGKRRQRLKVICTNGERLTRTRAISRTLLKFIPWELAHTCIWQIRFALQEPSPTIMAGFVLVWILVGINVIKLWLSPTHQTLYDWLAGTYVVKG
jgi:uncharacterized RDD family membrane protein YckC